VHYAIAKRVGLIGRMLAGRHPQRDEVIAVCHRFPYFSALRRSQASTSAFL
jgi:hypothetical protein